MIAIQALIASSCISAREIPNAEQNTCRERVVELCTVESTLTNLIEVVGNKYQINTAESKLSKNQE